MQSTRLKSVALLLAVALAVPTLLVGQTREEQLRLGTGAIARAEAAVSAAEAAGAPIYAQQIYEEARSRLTWARANLQSPQRATRSQVILRAEEALHAARAAEAISRHTAGIRQAVGLREDIVRFGGTAPVLTAREFPLEQFARGLNSRERLAFTQQIVEQAGAENANLADPVGMEQARTNIRTAQTVLRNRTESDSADHLLYVAEMIARRAWAISRGRDVEGVLPGLRMERTRLAQEAAEREAVAERQRREALEREAADLRQRAAQEATARRMQEQEIAALRQQMAEHERRIVLQLEQDRQARIAAEQRLADLRAEQDRIRAGADPVEIDRLRRQVEDQALALRQVTERERESEQRMTAEIARLRSDLERERQTGVASQALAQREAELRQREEEIARLRREREEVEQRRLAAEAEVERARLAEAERMQALQRALSEIAETRAVDGGLTVILPGIYFQVGRATLETGAMSALTRIAEQLRGNERVQVRIVGHTDSTGSAQLNQRLSEQRAQAVADHLIQQGIAAARITAEGRGQHEPIASNATAAGRQQNRRVELLITQ
jgi:outer membrane protein OmpA-like peptidoglycan-associated protein